MTYLELEALKQSSEYKAAEALTDALNSFGWEPARFAQALTTQHRTLQQGAMRTFIAVIRLMASEDYGYDARNQAAHDLAKRIADSGVLDNDYLPFI